MRRNSRRTWCSLLFVLLAVPVAPKLAAGQDPTAKPAYAIAPALVDGADATLYEVTENMRLIGKVRDAGQSPRSRRATSELTGIARRGTPLCPAGVPGTGNCTINVTGKDDVDLATGMGSLGGSFTVVVQDTNTTDSPEVVVMKGKFVGFIDFRPALDPLRPMPYGLCNAVLVVDGGRSFPFTGVFRQPVDLGFGAVYFTGNSAAPFVAVKANEFSLGYPTVRFEIKFTAP